MFDFFKRMGSNRKNDLSNDSGKELYDTAMKRLSDYLKDLQTDLNDNPILLHLLEEIEGAFQTNREDLYLFYVDEMMMADKWDFLANKLVELHRNSPSMSHPLYCELIPIYAFRFRYSNPLAELDNLPERAAVSMDFTAKILDALCSEKGDYFICNFIFREIEEELVRKKNSILEKKRMLEITDSYGFKDSSKWDLEKRYLANKILDNLSLELQDHVNSEQFREIYVGIISEHLIENVTKSFVGEPIINPEPTNTYEAGLQFENECRTILEENGWSVFDTAVSGDKGADLIAVYDDVRVAIQCKNWQAKIGTSAIQEIETGKSIYDAALGVVVSKAGYTKQAIEIAEKLNIILLCVSELGDLDSIVKRHL